MITPLPVALDCIPVEFWRRWPHLYPAYRHCSESVEESSSNQYRHLAKGVGKLAGDVREIIESTRVRVAQSVNAELVMMNWKIGVRIHRDVLAEARAEYGEQLVSTLSRQLTAEYGAGFSRQNLFHMVRFVEAWPDEALVSELAQHLGWSHFKEILYLPDPLARQFYAEMCRMERWSVRTLRERVRGMLFERTAISRLPEAAIRQELEQLRESDKMTPELGFRDSYLLDFLGLQDTYIGDPQKGDLRHFGFHQARVKAVPR